MAARTVDMRFWLPQPSYLGWADERSCEVTKGVPGPQLVHPFLFLGDQWNIRAASAEHLLAFLCSRLVVDPDFSGHLARGQ